MAVHFIYRSAYETPLGRRITRFEDADLLAWFQRVWPDRSEFPEDEDRWFEHADSLAESAGLGNVYGIHSLFEQMAVRGEAPQNERALKQWLDGQTYPEGGIAATGHAWQAETDDDELDLALMMFDDHYAERHPERCTFLLHPDPELPTDVNPAAPRFSWRGRVNDLKPRGSGNGAIYIILLVIEDTGWLTDLLGPIRFKGLRLPDFTTFLGQVPDRVIEESEAIEGWNAKGQWREELVNFRRLAGEHSGYDLRQLLETFEAEEDTTFHAQDQTDWTWKKRRYPSMIQVSEHFAQIAFRTTSSSDFVRGGKGEDQNLQWYFFDDLWAASHPDLARSLLHYAADATPLIDY